MKFNATSNDQKNSVAMIINQTKFGKLFIGALLDYFIKINTVPTV